MVSTILFCLGLVIFLSGLYILKTGLAAFNYLNLKKIIYNFTSTPLKGCLAGTLLTMILQSSSEITVVTIGLTDTDIMSFKQGIGIILGTNIGTTITGQIMAFNLEKMGFPLLFLGLSFLLVPGKGKKVALGICGLALIFIGLNYMSTAFLFIQDNPLFYQILLMTNNNTLLGIGAGIIFTAIIQSSSAMTGIVLALAKSGHLTIVSATAIILGSNVGTCITAVLASISSTTGGKRIAATHVILNMVGVIVVYPFIQEFTHLMTYLSSSLPRQIAHTHTVFNIISSLIVLPFTNPLARFISWLIPEKN